MGITYTRHSALTIIGTVRTVVKNINSLSEYPNNYIDNIIIMIMKVVII